MASTRFRTERVSVFNPSADKYVNVITTFEMNLHTNSPPQQIHVESCDTYYGHASETWREGTMVLGGETLGTAMCASRSLFKSQREAILETPMGEERYSKL